MFNYLLSTYLTRCYGLLRTVLFKLYVFRPHYFSFIVCPSILDDLPPLVAVALSSSCPDLLKVFNYMVRVSKIAAYLLRGEMHVDSASSNVDDLLVLVPPVGPFLGSCHDCFEICVVLFLKENVSFLPLM